MANQYASQVTATQVGSYFVQQYYQVFQQQRDYVHQFYNESSTMLRVDGEISHSASDMVKIHQLLMSLNFTGIEIKTINSLESWNRGVLVVVTGSVKSIDFNYWRTFVQTFFLAPQEKGYFVLNDMFHFADNEVAHQSSSQVPTQERNVDYHPTISTHHPDPPAVSDYALEEEAAEYVHSVHIDRDEPVQDFAYQEHLQPEAQHEMQPELEPELESEVDRLDEGTPYEEPNPLLQHTVTTVQEPHLSVEESIREPEKLTYASILRAKGKSPPSLSSQPAFTQRSPVTDWNHVSKPLQQHSTPNPANSASDVREDALSSHEGEPKSVYVRNLPSTITSMDIQQEFENFGRITYDGVFLRNRADTGVCYAFVEFEDIQSVRNALQASPIQLAGRKVYIEERRPNSGASRGGRSGGRGRGRGGRTYGK
ncbi:Nuclear transport factor 2 (NTF2) family protein with RNA binding (RRM-RBD-RNP motifs) domain [Striga hermonthica]|uniref:Nuclear transport factor 2 (NTF2) family protein with RNA binding (RRM-RBD-RNP motifs) domain n=1 Tax=Striga hermonthica TaxID=68872 RepID=A0A9N7N9W0_STRHE|nr:Nuclear transport factor 2 (NTF2) family protein with RNA binding (RRM-RBD-RNP motifs) domain [Striga hermonthica]